MSIIDDLKNRFFPSDSKDTDSVLNDVRYKEAVEYRNKRLKDYPNYDPSDRRLHDEYLNAIKNGDQTWVLDGFGPRIETRVNCGSCTYFESVRTVVTRNRGEDARDGKVTVDNRCSHPSVGGMELQGSCSTPSWCPYLETYAKQAHDRILSEAERNAK